MNNKISVRRLALVGMLTALVFAGNYARINIPMAIAGRTSFTLANILCCLSGLILGPIGGVASGLGSALYDILADPTHASECWITFLTKGAMGFAAGLVVQKALAAGRLTYPRALAGAAAGCVAYYTLYFAKTFFYSGLLLKGLTVPVAAAMLLEKVPASIFNGSIAIIAAPPLTIAVLAALKRSRLDRLLAA